VSAGEFLLKSVSRVPDLIFVNLHNDLIVLINPVRY
jgi:hypothetical protein